MNLKQLETFIRVADNKSFSQAAKEMYQTQPTISMSVSKLEEELGTQLFIRSSKSVELTEDGKAVYLYARRILDNAENMQKAVRKEDLFGRNKPVLVAASSVPARLLLPGIIEIYKRDHPDALVSVKELNSREVIREVEQNKVDIGFCSLEKPGRNLVFQPFCRDEIILITPNNAKYRKILASEKDLSWLKKVPIIMREQGSGTRDQTIRYLKKLGIGLEELNIAAIFTSAQAILQSVRNETGASFISMLEAEEGLKKGEFLRAGMIAGIPRTFYLVRHTNLSLSEAGREIALIAEELYKNTGENRVETPT